MIKGKLTLCFSLFNFAHLSFLLFLSHTCSWPLFSLAYSLYLSLTCVVSTFFHSFCYIYIGGRGGDDDNEDCILNRCASICAIESNSISDTRKFVAGWVFFLFVDFTLWACFNEASWMVILVPSIICLCLVALLPCCLLL